MKYIPFFIVIFMIFVLIGKGMSKVAIPKDAIRVRVIANSNSDYDQKMKYKVKEKVEDDMYGLLKNVKGVDQARNIIKNNVSLVDKDVNDVLINNNYNMDYDINFGYNYFPKKKFKGVTYKEGYYESLVVTLGEGKGDNWWCVLFPPLCMMEASDSDNVEYTTFVKEMVDKYL